MRVRKRDRSGREGGKWVERKVEVGIELEQLIQKKLQWFGLLLQQRAAHWRTERDASWMTSPADHQLGTKEEEERNGEEGRNTEIIKTKEYTF